MKQNGDADTFEIKTAQSLINSNVHTTITHPRIAYISHIILPSNLNSPDLKYSLLIPDHRRANPPPFVT
jgi:hypothetical protein